MYYEINVSLNGSHFFATSSRSIRDKTELDKVHSALSQAFTPARGYVITVTHWTTVGEPISMEKKE